MTDEQRTPPAASRFDGVDVSLIRQINALATPLSLNLGLGEPNLRPDDRLMEMVERAARETPWSYSPNAGFLSLRQAISDWHGGLADPPDGICVTAGTQEGLHAVITAFVNPGDEVLVPDPGFLSYPALVRLAGGEPVGYPLETGSWTVDPDEIESRLSSRTRAIVINSPSNPTGGVLSRHVLEQIADLADRHGCLLISDEVYREIHYGERPPTLLGLGRNSIVLTGLSKSHGLTGLRIGWILGPGTLMRSIIKAHQYITTCASVASQRLAEQVLSDRPWNEGWLAGVRAQFRGQRETALFGIEHRLHTRISPPEGAFYAFVPIPACRSLELARELATDAGVIVIPGVAFGEQGEGFVRISYAAPHEIIGSGIERIGRYLDGRALR